MAVTAVWRPAVEARNCALGRGLRFPDLDPCNFGRQLPRNPLVEKEIDGSHMRVCVEPADMQVLEQDIAKGPKCHAMVVRHVGAHEGEPRSEEHTSELQSLMRISYAVFCLKTKTNITHSQQQARQQ